MPSSVENDTHLGKRDVQEDRRASASITLVRFVLVVILAAAVCRALWAFAPSSLHVTTPVVGTPTFQGFNYPRYFDAFYLIAIVFPVVATGLYFVAARFGPLAYRAPSAPLLPLRLSIDTGNPDEERASWFALPFRLGLPALTVALEASAARSTNTSSFTVVGVIAGLGYVAAVVVVAYLLPGPPFAMIRAGGRSLATRLAAVNALGAPVVVLLGAAVSATTSVTVSSPLHVVHYDWLPWWLAIVFTVSILAVIALRLRKTTTAGAILRLEGSVMVGVIGSVLVYFAVASLPGALGAFGGFDDAQYLAGAQLTFFHGLLPWKDIYLLHGMIEDVFDGIIGFAVLSHSRWGAVAGQSLIVYPISFCIYYLFVVYFARRNRVIPLIAAIVIIVGEATAIMRFAYLPLTVMAFDKVLRERQPKWCVTFAGLVVLEAILTPEMALMAIGLLATLILFESTSRKSGGSWVDALFCTRWVILSGATLIGLWLLYLIMTGSLGAFVDYYRVFGSDHALWGAYAIQWSLRGDPRATVWFILPVALELATIWRFVGRVRARRPLSTRDWSLVAAASFALLYYEKGLDRPDTGHFAEVFTVCMPLVLLWGIEGIQAVEAVFRRFGTWFSSLGSSDARTRRGTGWLVRRRGPMGVACVVLLLSLVPQLFTTIDNIPGRLHAGSPVDPQNQLLGYTIPGTVNFQEVNNLGRIIDAYTPPGGPVFDFANEPGIVYYLLNRVPGSRFFHVEEAETPRAQDEVIKEVADSRPNLVIFSDNDFGLPTVDGIVGPVRNYLVSQYLLDHYTPFADDDGQLVLIRNDLAHKVAPVSSLHLPGVVKGYRGLYFAGAFACNWGDVPNFLTPLPAVGGEGALQISLSGGSSVNTEITGWAVDDRQHVAARQVFAVSGGRVIGRAQPDVYRLDIEDYFANSVHWTKVQAARVANSGFVLNLDLGAHEPVQIYALNSDGTVTRIIPAPPPATRLGHGLNERVHLRAITTSDGRRHSISTGTWLSGWVNTFGATTARVYTLRLPRTLDLAAFRELQVASAGVLGSAQFTLGDVPYDTGREIQFASLSSSVGPIRVPVGSCLQWHGYRGPLTLIERGGNALNSVVLRS